MCKQKIVGRATAGRAIRFVFPSLTLWLGASDGYRGYFDSSHKRYDRCYLASGLKLYPSNFVYFNSKYQNLQSQQHVIF